MKALCSVLATTMMFIVAGTTQSCFAQDVIAGTEFPSVDAISPAPDGEARAFYDAATGKIHVTVGAGVLVLSLEGAPLNLSNLNLDTPLGRFENCECGPGGISQLSFSGLTPGGPYDFGDLLPADPSIRTALDFSNIYPNAIFRSGAAGVAEVRSQVNVIPVAIPEPAGGIVLLAGGFARVGMRRRKIL